MKSLDQQMDWPREYENLRREALQVNSHRGHGLALFLSRGMMAWLEALTALESRSVSRSTEQESVDLAPVVRSVEVAVGGAIVRCEAGVDVEYVAALVRALGER